MDDDGNHDAAPGIDEATLYRIVHDAVEDAILGVVGTLLLVGVSFVVVATGFSIAVQAESPTGTALGASAIAVGVYVAAATLKLIPPIREWA